MNNENIISIYNRTYNNCKFYFEKGENRRLLNEIGVLRGIVYCIQSIIGENNKHFALNRLIDFPAFLEMIEKQNEFLEGE